MTKAITLWQPYASFIAWGVKEYETRSWHPPSTLRPGQTLLIHAAKRKPKEYERRLLQSILLQDVWREQGVTTLDDLPYGALVCAVRFVDAEPTKLVAENIGGLERIVGNYQPGRWAWKLDLVRVADPPVPARGQQGLWNYNAKTEDD